MVPGCAEFVEPVRREMQIAAKRTWDRLRFVMIIKTGKIAPTWIARYLDQTGTNHSRKPEPAKEPDHEQGRTAVRKWATIEQWAKKDRQEPGLEQLRFPTIAVPDLSYVNDGHVHRPENAEENRVGETAKDNKREAETDPGKDR